MPRSARQTLLSIALVDTCRFKGGRRRANPETELSVLSCVPWVLDDRTVLWPTTGACMAAVRAAPDGPRFLEYRHLGRPFRRPPIGGGLDTATLQPILDGARAAADLSFAEPDPDEKPIPLDLGIDRNIATAETWLVSRRKNADARISRPLRRRIAARFHHNLRHLRAALAANPDAVGAFDQTVRLLNAVAGITPDTELLDDLLDADEAGQRVRQWAARFPTGMIAALEPALDENGHAFSSYVPVWQTLGIRDAVIAGRPDREVLARLHAGKRSDGPASDLPAGRLRTAFSSPTRAIRRFRHVRNPDGDRSLGGQAITPDEAAGYARIVAGGPPQHDLPPEHLAIDHDIAHANFGLDRTDPAVAALRRRLLERARNRLARLDAHGIDALPTSVAAAARRYGLPLRPTGLRCAVLAMQDFNDLRREHRDARISARDAFLPGHTLPADIFDPRPIDNPWDALYRHRGTGTPRWQEWIGFAERWRDGGGHAIAAAVARTDAERNAKIRWESPAPPPVNGVAITPILSAQALFDEGNDLRHCIGGFTNRCLREEAPVHAYNLATPDGIRTTVAVTEQGQRPWEVLQHAGDRNAAAPPAHRSIVGQMMAHLNASTPPPGYHPERARHARRRAERILKGAAPEENGKRLTAHREAFLRVFPELAKVCPGLAVHASKPVAAPPQHRRHPVPVRQHDPDERIPF